MPKGDRLKLKADPEDGTTPISNLLLEAVAMAKLSGLQKGAILYLWRQTYGWVENGKRVKERQIGLSEWVRALDAVKSSISTALTELERKNVIFRRLDRNWGSYFYSVNTNIRSWNTDCLNLEQLAKSIQLPKTVQFFEAVQSETSEESVEGKQLVQPEQTVTQNRTEQLPKTVPCTLYKERLKKDKERRDDKILSSPIGEKVQEVFAFLDKERGYRPPKRKAEAASIMRMLKMYTVEQITYTWKYLKQDKFWGDKELLMMSVENQIGAIVSKKKKENIRW